MTDRLQTTKTRAVGWLVLPTRLALGGIFTFAGVLKLLDPQSFAFAVKGFKVLPDHLIVPTAFAVPTIEILAGVLLILGLWTRASALTIFLLLIGFTVGMGAVIHRGESIKCTCFGKIEWPCSGAIGTCHLIRNSVLGLMAIVIVAWGPGPLVIDRQRQR